MKAKKIVFLVSCVTAFFVNEMNAQDVHFSQFNETPQLLNPGATGVYNGYMRGIINYKNQGMQIKGNEAQIRYCISEYIFRDNLKTDDFYQHLFVGVCLPNYRHILWQDHVKTS